MPDKSVQLDSLHVLALRGLRLAPGVRRRLQKTRVYCQPAISIEYQQQAQQHVLRGIESGGAVAELGAYCGFVTEDGGPLSWLQAVDTIGANGPHAIAIATTLVRVQVLRYRQTYDVLITRHALTSADPRRRPRLDNRVIFHARQGTLALELWGRDAGFRGSVAPIFHNRAGEKLTISAAFLPAVKQTLAGSCCIGCSRHTHVLVPPQHACADAPGQERRLPYGASQSQTS